ncbi:hypothetical protein Ahy_B06g085349 [Arachis hypogaea]|uniref:Uncharacterized protein n=1 Tax=Arachis hypogaea TaxID=3818 RepID=A0A444YU91_ARAHY|nr:hypothetical protein Ahy_B06g085349 [Arachis hypogaea]
MASHHDDSRIPPATGDSVPATSCPFRPPHSERRPAPQMSTDSTQNSLPGHVNLGANTNEVDSLEEEVDDLIDASGAQSRKGRKTTEFWTQIFHFDEDSEGTIKKILKSMGKSWKEIRMRLYSDFYDPTFTTEQNIDYRPPGIDREHWRWFLDYRAKAETKERIEEIGQQDESSKVLSPNDSIAQVFGKERPGRVRGVGSGPTPSQLFGLNSHVTVNGVQVEETQRKLLELQAELEGEKLKRKVMEDEAAVEKKKRQAMKSALIYLYQQQGEELPPEIAVGISSVD